MKNLLLLGTLALLFGTFSASAQEQLGENPIRAKLFYLIDAAGDGTITLDELKAVDPSNSSIPAATKAAADGLTAEEIFGQIDTDKNGNITRAEFVNANIPGLDQVYGYLVTFVNVIPVSLIYSVNEADANVDGVITKPELIAFEEAHGSTDGARFFDALDIDGNGFLDAIEYNGLPQKIEVIITQGIYDTSNDQ